MPVVYPKMPDTTLSRLLGDFDPLDLVGGVGIAKLHLPALMEQLRNIPKATMRGNIGPYSMAKGGMLMREWGDLEASLANIAKNAPERLDIHKRIALLKHDMDKLLGTRLSPYSKWNRYQGHD